MKGIGFELIKDLGAITHFYSGIPMTSNAQKSSYQLYEISAQDENLLMEDFVDAINDRCGTLLDYGDIDYFDASKCIQLKAWLDYRLSQPCAPRLRDLYTVLLDFATQAIRLGTGVVVTI